jgi:hypothetical protein
VTAILASEVECFDGVAVESGLFSVDISLLILLQVQKISKLL